MELNTFLLYVIGVELGLFVLAFVVVMARSLAMERILRRREQLWQSWKELLSEATVEGHEPLGLVERLSRLPVRDRMRLIMRFGEQLRGRGEGNLQRIAERIGVVQHARNMCASHRWGQRALGIQALVLLRTGDDQMAKLLDDRHVEVRKLAYGWLGTVPDRAHLEHVMARWGAMDFEERAALKDALARCGDDGVHVVREVLATRPEDMDLLDVAAAMPDASFIEAARRAIESPAPHVRLRGAALWAYIRPREGNDILEQLLLTDEDETVRIAVARALGMLADQRTGKSLERAMADASWRVRLEVATALQALGPAGELRLRKLSEDAGGAGKTARFAMAVAEAHA